MKKIIIGLLTTVAFPVLAQEQQPKCQPRHTISPSFSEETVMNAVDGDRWVVLTNKGTGDQILGVIKKGSFLFCPADMGKIQRAT